MTSKFESSNHLSRGIALYSGIKELDFRELCLIDLELRTERVAIS